MARRLPPLNQLRAFEAAARHRSFKRAAEELNVTQAAISHQIKALETGLQTPLFIRLTREVRPTPAAETLAAELTAALDRVAAAVEAVDASRRAAPLRLSSAPFFGNRWLLPRLGRFRAQRPDIVVRINLDFEVLDFATSDIDAAIRYGDGGWTGLAQERLSRDEVCPVAAPALLGGRAPPLTPQEIAALPLAMSTDRPEEWTDWFAAAGAPDVALCAAVQFSNRALTHDFALSGNGAAIADLRITELDVQAGRLIRLHPTTVTREMGMFLVYPIDRRRDPRITALAQWLHAEMAAG